MKHQKNSKELDSCVKEIATITGQQPTINTARKSVAGFKIRDGMPVGISVTLRQGRSYAFLEKINTRYFTPNQRFPRFKP